MDTNKSEYSASALYDGGWRAKDYTELQAEYNLSTTECDVLCKLISQYEEE